jgi:hypothetical protein
MTMGGEEAGDAKGQYKIQKQARAAMEIPRTSPRRNAKKRLGSEEVPQ